MKANFTEAVEADTTAQESTVKRLRRGDVREDGMVFWQHLAKAKGGEYWVTPEKFATKRTTEKAKYAKKKADLSAKKASLPTKLRCGTPREDGWVFWAYVVGCLKGERWLTPEQFASEKAAEKSRQAKKRVELSAKKAALPTKLRRGDTRDGMVFWAYAAGHVNGEYWMTPEKFATEKTKTNARLRERRATDPLYALKGRLRDRVHKAFKRKGFKKSTKTAIMLGCTYEEFKAHIESKFLPGMSWANFSGCHIDHTVPLDAAVTEDDVYALNHFTNLRPMWGPDNLAKNDTLPEEHELPENLHTKVKEIYLTAKARSA